MIIVRLKDDKQLVGIYDAELMDMEEFYWRVNEIADPSCCEFTSVYNGAFVFERKTAYLMDEFDDDDFPKFDDGCFDSFTHNRLADGDYRWVGMPRHDEVNSDCCVDEYLGEQCRKISEVLKNSNVVYL